ncbi:hypothetical protein M434DRAFT_9481 [Hypoxylon sp. CO27-5]|nr:hypothetical protein M434DRAFT_9481 [Hypoxylon sp. CO27-5]
MSLLTPLLHYLRLTGMDTKLLQLHVPSDGRRYCMMNKRIIVCCDGTWQNSDNGYVKPTAFNPIPTLQIPSNVTRISRAFKSTCSDGTFQVVYYQSGVGSKSGIVDRILGGAFGIGIAENIREAYSYICANYVDGDEIVLVGFSRGAFTARSIGGMISDLGLLTREGMEFFYPIFKDMQNWMNEKYKDQFPLIPFPDKPKGSHAAEEYQKKLVEIEHGFHALALDETRGPFCPTLWEQQPEDRDASNLRQVWFPGNHGNVGGGWADQGTANITLAWMMDQLSSVGCEFVDDTLRRLYDRNVQYYHNLDSKKSHRKKCDICCCVRCVCCLAIRRKKTLPWAARPIFHGNKPVRPWSLHSIQSVKSPIYDLTGSVTRSPGMYRKMNPETGRRQHAFLKDTNERIHSSVRCRLACEGLGLNDSDFWKCPALLRSWRPRRVAQKFPDPVPQNAIWGPKDHGGNTRGLNNITNGDVGGANRTNGTPDTVIHGPGKGKTQNGNSSSEMRWVWEYIGPDVGAPYVRTLVEESIGPWEKQLLALSGGDPQVYEYAETQDVSKFKAFRKKSRSKKSRKANKSSP